MTSDTEDLDTLGKAQVLAVTRHRLQQQIRSRDAVAAELEDALAPEREALERAAATLQAARDAHPLFVQVEELNQAIAASQDQDESLVDDLKAAWTHGEKTIATEYGAVTRSTRKGVRVTDPEAAARDLLDRRLFAYVKDLKVDVAGIRPLLDAGGVAGLEADDKASISVRVKEAPQRRPLPPAAETTPMWDPKV